MSDAGQDRYRRLYEGSQASLAEMSARQAEALARVGRLRNAVVMLLRRNFASSFEHAEVTLGSRLSEVDDEILLAYLNGLVDQAAQTQRQFDALRSALTAAGFDPSLDADALAALLARPTNPAPRETQSTTPRESQPTPPGPAEQMSLGELIGSMLEDTPLSDLFSDVAPELWDEPEAATTGFAPSPVKPFARPLSSAVKPQPAIPQAESNPPRAPEEPHAEDPSSDAGFAAEDELAIVTDADHPFDDFTAIDDFSDGFAVTGEDDFGFDFDDVPADLEPSPEAAEPVQQTELEPAPSSTSAANQPEAVVEPPAKVSAEQSTPAPAPPTAVTPSSPLRPGLPPAQSVPARSTRRNTRKVRTQATRPEPGLFDVPIQGPDSAEVSDDHDQRLVAAVLMPRPVFSSDLIAMGTPAEVVGAWEETLRSDPAASPVRFISAKSRHRTRGSLIIPVNPEPGSKDSWWADCVRTYRGARLYEMGVLLHRVGAELVSARFGANTATLRLNTRSGLVGLVVTFDASLDVTDPARDEVATELVELFAERMVLVAILSTSGAEGAVETLAAEISALAAEQQWAVSCPVVAARSYEYAMDRGSSATLVLGA